MFGGLRIILLEQTVSRVICRTVHKTGVFRLTNQQTDPSFQHDLNRFENDTKSLWYTTLPQRKKKAYGLKMRKNIDLKPAKMGPVLIKCRRPELNHHAGQKYDKFLPIPLASKGWKNKKSKGDFFTIHLSNENPAFKKMNYETEEGCIPFEPFSFDDLEINPKLIECLKTMEIIEPTHIQSLVIPHILRGKNTLITAETGCGKTLAYLLPILHKILLWKEQLKDIPFNSPLVFIVVPSRDLAQQVGQVVEKFCKHLDLTCKTFTGGHTKRLIMNPEFGQVDIVVSSFGAISKLTTFKVYNTRMCKYLVLDEADTLFDDSFNEKSVHFIGRFPVLSDGPKDPSEIPDGTLISLVSATMPRSLPEIVHGAIDLENIERISTFHLHRVQPHVPQTFKRMGKADKPIELLKIAKHAVTQKKPLMIFSNKSSTCSWISLFLNDNGIKCLCLHSNMPVDRRAGLYGQYKDGSYQVVSCTDIASRGLDTVMVKHVLNYDFPMYMADYIHRCGRTGRVGSSKDCEITNFIAGLREVDMLHKVETSVRTSDSLPNVNANITRIINHKTYTSQASPVV